MKDFPLVFWIRVGWVDWGKTLFQSVFISNKWHSWQLNINRVGHLFIGIYIGLNISFTQENDSDLFNRILFNHIYHHTTCWEYANVENVLTCPFSEKFKRGVYFYSKLMQGVISPISNTVNHSPIQFPLQQDWARKLHHNSSQRGAPYTRLLTVSPMCFPPPLILTPAFRTPTLTLPISSSPPLAVPTLTLHLSFSPQLAVPTLTLHLSSSP